MTDRRRAGEFRSQARPRGYEPAPGPAPAPARRSPITPTGVLLVVALIGSLAYILYAITVRDASQIPLLVSGAVVLGIVFIAIAITGLVATWRSSVRGSDGRAFGHAIVGGIACLAAAGCFAVAIILTMVSQTS